MDNQKANTAEQWVAALVGLCLSGPVGAVAAWQMIRALRGKWFPWCLTGLVAAPVLSFVQVVTLSAIGIQMGKDYPYDAQQTTQTTIIQPSKSEVGL